MIVDMVKGDVFKAPYNHIAFAVNTEGYNDAGFAGQVSSRFWPELANTGEKKLGEVLTKKTDDKTFHALVCHSLGEDGWNNAPKTVKECLDSINIPDEETIAVVLIGGGMVGRMSGANVLSILGGMARSKQKLAVYRL